MRKEKQIHLDEITEKIDESNAMMLMSYQGISANMAAVFRRDLTKAGGRLTVVPKRMFIKAAQESGITLERKVLEGHVGVIFTTDDPVASAKVLWDFHKDNEDKTKILGGQFEGSMISPDDVKQIAKLPGMQEMRSQVVGLFEASISGALSTINALLTSVMGCLENKSKKS